MEAERLLFQDRSEFRAFLSEHALSQEGIWLIFSKTGALKTLKASEALEEALCFGWIDGQMKSIDEHTYIKYFKQRNSGSNWSEKNKKLVSILEEKGLMTEYGKIKIKEAQQNGQWESREKPTLTPEMLKAFEEMLFPYETALENFKKMAPSVQKTYAASYYFGAKTEAGKSKRFAVILDRLALNLNPMESLRKK